MPSKNEKIALNCPHCGSKKGSSVLNTRKNKVAKAIRRYRKCLACNELFSTYEVISKDFNKINDRLEMYKEIFELLAESHTKIRSFLNKTEINFQRKKEFYKNKKSRNSWRKLP